MQLRRLDGDTQNTSKMATLRGYIGKDLNRDQNRIQAVVRYFPLDKPSIMQTAVAGIGPRVMAQT